MKAVREHLGELIRSMKETREFKTYSRLSEKISSRPELKNRLDEYRREQLRLVSESRNIYDEEENLTRQFQDILKLPEVVEFLNAESAVLYMVRSSCLEISSQIVLNTPEE